MQEIGAGIDDWMLINMMWFRLMPWHCMGLTVSALSRSDREEQL